MVSKLTDNKEVHISQSSTTNIKLTSVTELFRQKFKTNGEIILKSKTTQDQINVMFDLLALVNGLKGLYDYLPLFDKNGDCAGYILIAYEV